jgi:hypothetical protein
MLRVLTIFEVPFLTLFEADFRLPFPHTVERTGREVGDGIVLVDRPPVIIGGQAMAASR